MVFNDSAQLGDRPEWDKTIGNFSNFNEPYYRNYVSCDLGAMFEEAGFKSDMKFMASASKCLSFIKPNSGVSAPGEVAAINMSGDPKDN